MKLSIHFLTLTILLQPAFTLAESISTEEPPAQVIQTGGGYYEQYEQLSPGLRELMEDSRKYELPEYSKKSRNGLKRPLLPQTAQEAKDMLKKLGYCELDREEKRFQKELTDAIVVVEHEDGKYDLMSSDDLLSSRLFLKRKFYKRMPKEEIHFFTKCEAAPSV